MRMPRHPLVPGSGSGDGGAPGLRSRVVRPRAARHRLPRSAPVREERNTLRPWRWRRSSPLHIDTRRCVVQDALIDGCRYKPTIVMPEVLFVCVHNAGRSQMAAGLVKLRSDGRIHVRSAGSAPAETINPVVVEAMAEVGVDISDELPKPLTDAAVRAADVVITMGCGDACP